MTEAHTEPTGHLVADANLTPLDLCTAEVEALRTALATAQEENERLTRWHAEARDNAHAFRERAERAEAALERVTRERNDAVRAFQRIEDHDDCVQRAAALERVTAALGHVQEMGQFYKEHIVNAALAPIPQGEATPEGAER